jgi:cardiolipin synthase
MRHLPNIICLARIVLIWPIVAGLVEGAYERTLVLFVVAALSDGLDGWLAKRFGWTSALGKFLDPLADKLLLVTVFLVLAWLGLVPHWLVIAAVARDVMIGVGALAFRIGWGPLRGKPIASSKLNTLLQLLYVPLIVVHAQLGQPPQTVLDALAVATLLTVLYSGFAYLHAFTGRALQIADRG